MILRKQETSPNLICYKEKNLKMKNLIKDTWLAGLMLFGFLKSQGNNTKAVEVIAEDHHPDKSDSTEKSTKNE